MLNLLLILIQFSTIQKFILFQVQRIDGVIFLDPQFDYHQDSGQITSGEIEIGSGIRNEFDNFRLNVLPIIRYFEKQEILYKVI